MNILYIDHYAGSLEYGMEFRPYYLAREWEKLGYKVRIIAGNFSHLRTTQPTVKKDFQIDYVDNIEYQWIKTGTYQGNGVSRALTMFKFVGKLFVNARKIVQDFKPDVVITSSTYPLDSFAGYRIAKKAKAKYIHETHDIWPLTLVEIGGMKRYHPFVILMGIAEKYAYRKAGKVICLFPNAVEHMLECGLQSKEKYVAIPNGIALEDWELPEKLNDTHKKLFNQLKEKGKFIICYVGGHALSNKLDLLLNAAKQMKHKKELSFVLIGKGVEKERLQKRVQEEKIDNVFFLPPIPKKQVPSVLAEADALYIGAKTVPIYRFGVSLNKVYDYMMSGKPILYGVEAFNNDVAEAGCGITFDSNDEDGLRKAIEELQSLSSTERHKMGDNGKKWVLENCEYKKISAEFLSVIYSCQNIK